VVSQIVEQLFADTALDRGERPFDVAGSSERDLRHGCSADASGRQAGHLVNRRRRARPSPRERGEQSPLIDLAVLIGPQELACPVRR
jgi:hypothetical protein